MRTKTTHQPWRSYRATVSSKGQIVIPAALQRHLRWAPGAWLLGETVDGGFALRRVDPALGRAIRARGRARRKLTDGEVLLLALLDDPATTDATLQAHLARLRGHRTEASHR